MMYNGMMGGLGFGLVFLLIYLGLGVYFFYLLASIARSLGRIADRMERLSALGCEPEKRDKGE